MDYRSFGAAAGFWQGIGEVPWIFWEGAFKGYLDPQIAKIMDPILPVLSILGYWPITLGSFL